MEIRKITAGERLQASKVSTVAFLGQMDPNYNEDYQSPPEPGDDCERIWAAYDGDKKMVSLLHIHDFQMCFDGHTVGMGGIGGVSTLPEARTGGYMRRINEVILPYMKERGMVFSFLYPWSYAFYRKFGYELCYTPNHVRIPMDFFRNYPFPDNITMYESGGDTAPYHEVYTAFIQDKNLPIARSPGDMRERMDKDPYVTRTYAYLHRDAAGKPDAYILYKADMRGDSGNSMRVRELVWSAADGLHALFGFIGGLAPQFEHFIWDAPSAFNVFPLFPESYEISVSRPAKGMNRILNVQKAFELMQAPEQPGRVSIQVKDKFMPCNDGIYTVEWESNQVTSVKRASAPADMETDVETLAQLVTGFITPEVARMKRAVQIKGNEARLQDLFPLKNLIMMDSF
jgi:predicted acetyltransferase